MLDLLKPRAGAASIGLTVGLTVVLASCSFLPGVGSKGASPSPSVAAPCASTGPPVSLGYTGEDDEPVLFTSDGSELIFAADGFSHGGISDIFGKVKSTAVSVGNPTRMPVYNAQTSVLTNVTHEFRIIEGKVTRQTLPAGRYWLVNSNGVHVTVRSCPPFGVNLFAPGQASSSTVNGNLLDHAPMDFRVGDQLRLVVKSFRAGSRVDLLLVSPRRDLGSVTADASGAAKATVTVPPMNPGVHELELEGEGAGRVQVTRQALIRVPGRPSGGYTTYLCCFQKEPETVTADTVTESVSVSVSGINIGDFPSDPDGGVLLTLPTVDRLTNPASLVIKGTSSVTGKMVEEWVDPIPTAPSLWATSTVADAISVTGPRFAADGRVHSEGGVRLRGAELVLTGGLEYVTTLDKAGGPERVEPTTRYVAGEGGPAVPQIERYRPGGAASRSGSRYTAVSKGDCVNGAWTPKPGRALTGVVYVPCGLTLNRSGTYGATFATEGPITISGSKVMVGQPLPKGAGHPSLVTAATGANGIRVTGADVTLVGQALAPSGQVHVSGVRAALGCGVVAARITVQGADSSARMSPRCLSP